MTKFCNTKDSQCLWSENSKFCEMLHNASVPLDNKWPPLILQLRSIGDNKFLGELQKSKMQELLLVTLQEKKFNDAWYDHILEQIHSILYAPYEQKLQEIAKEVTAITHEANVILGRHREKIASVADTVELDLHKGADPSIILPALRDALRDMAQKMEADTSKLLQLSHKDSLTGLANRRSFDEFLDLSVKSWEDTQQPVALILFDIDHFKKFNDTYGHLVGDQVLRTLASRIRSVIEPFVGIESELLAARYGGEEFGVLLKGDAALQAPFIAESLRKAVGASYLLLKDSNGNVVQSGLQVTVSLGVALLWEGWNGAYQMNLVDAADKALYKAKHIGRNCTVRFVPEEKEEPYCLVQEP